jgi:hypothetical protein
MDASEYQFTAKLWEYDGAGAWFFVTLPKAIAGEIRELFGTPRRGWGSIRVHATVGSTNWQTSIFPDKESGSYLLPVKSAVRQAERLTKGSTCTVLLRIAP